MVVSTTETPLRAIATPRWIAGQIVAVLEAGTHDGTLESWLRERITAERVRFSTDTSRVREWVPAEAVDPLRRMLRQEYSPNAEFLLRIIDQPALRGLVRVVLGETVARFRKRLGSVDSGLLGGIGKRAAERGRGLFGNVGRNFGGMAEGIVEAVKEEVEVSFDNKIKDFLQGATHEAMRTIANYIANPEHAASFGELRLGILDVLLDATLAELATEAGKMQPEEVVGVVVGAVRSSVSDPAFVEKTTQRVSAVLDGAGDGTLGAWLAEVGLLDVWTETTTELVADRLKAVVATPAFDTWFEGLFAE